MPSSQIVSLDKYYGLVIYKAQKIFRTLPKLARMKIELNDMIQEGFIGLLKATDRYDPKKGASFSTFASFYIDGAVKDYLRKQDPLTQKERLEVKELESAKQKLTQSLNRKPSLSDIAQALGVTEEEVIRRQDLEKTIISQEDLHQSDEEEGTQIAQELPSFDESGPEKEITTGELWNDVNDCLKEALDFGERAVLTLRILGELTLKKVAQVLNMDINKVHRQEKKARGKMKYCLEDKGWEVTDIVEIYTE